MTAQNNDRQVWLNALRDLHEENRVEVFIPMAYFLCNLDHTSRTKLQLIRWFEPSEAEEQEYHACGVWWNERQDLSSDVDRIGNEERMIACGLLLAILDSP